VKAIGGVNGLDPAPTLAQFENYVAEGKTHYFITDGGTSGGGGGTGSTSTGSEITSWVEAISKRDRERRDDLLPVAVVTTPFGNIGRGLGSDVHDPSPRHLDLRGRRISKSELSLSHTSVAVSVSLIASFLDDSRCSSNS
jgi:hypothetical protein